MFSKLLSQDHHHDHPVLGITCAAMAMFLFGVMGLFAKLLSADINPAAIAFYRNLTGVVLLGGYFVLTGKRHYLKTKRPGAHAVRAVVGTIGLVLTYSALAALSMSQATVLFFASSLILPVLGVLMLGEHVGLPRWIAILVGFCGVLIASQPLGMVPLAGVILALGAALFHALVGICLRWLGRTEGTLTTTFYFVLIGMLCLIPVLFFVDFQLPLGRVWMVVSVGIAGSFAQVFLSGAFKFAEPAAVAPVSYTSLIWAAVFDLLIWGTLPTFYVLTGGAVIIGCNLYILYREKNADSAYKNTEKDGVMP